MPRRSRASSRYKGQKVSRDAPPLRARTLYPLQAAVVLRKPASLSKGFRALAVSTRRL